MTRFYFLKDFDPGFLLPPVTAGKSRCLIKLIAQTAFTNRDQAGTFRGLFTGSSSSAARWAAKTPGLGELNLPSEVSNAELSSLATLYIYNIIAIRKRLNFSSSHVSQSLKTIFKPGTWALKAGLEQLAHFNFAKSIKIKQFIITGIFLNRCCIEGELLIPTRPSFVFTFPWQHRGFDAHFPNKTIGFEP